MIVAAGTSNAPRSTMVRLEHASLKNSGINAGRAAAEDGGPLAQAREQRRRGARI
jgi:hypothetical protein